MAEMDLAATAYLFAALAPWEETLKDWSDVAIMAKAAQSLPGMVKLGLVPLPLQEAVRAILAVDPEVTVKNLWWQTRYINLAARAEAAEAMAAEAAEAPPPPPVAKKEPPAPKPRAPVPVPPAKVKPQAPSLEPGPAFRRENVATWPLAWKDMLLHAVAHGKLLATSDLVQYAENAGAPPGGVTLEDVKLIVGEPTRWVKQKMTKPGYGYKSAEGVVTPKNVGLPPSTPTDITRFYTLDIVHILRDAPLTPSEICVELDARKWAWPEVTSRVAFIREVLEQDRKSPSSLKLPDGSYFLLGGLRKLLGKNTDASGLFRPGVPENTTVLVGKMALAIGFGTARPSDLAIKLGVTVDQVRVAFHGYQNTFFKSEPDGYWSLRHPELHGKPRGLFLPFPELLVYVGGMQKIIGISGVAGSGKNAVAAMLHPRGWVDVAMADPLKRVARDIYDFSELQLWGPSAERNKPDERYPRQHTWVSHSDKGVTCACCGQESYQVMIEDDLYEPSTEGLEPCYLTPRYALQRLGTEFGRDCYPNTWLDKAIRTARTLLDPADDGWSYTAKGGLNPRAPWGLGPLPRVEGVSIPDVRFMNEVLGVRAAGGKVIRVARPGAGLAKGAGQHASESEMGSLPDSLFDVVIVNDGTLEDLRVKVEKVVGALWT